jgi:hypothetical protein
LNLTSSRIIRFVAGALAYACLGPGLWAEDPADLVRHVERIREQGMTEAAREDLDVVASIRTGATLLRFVEGETPGEYLLDFSGTSCNLPEAEHGRVAQLQVALRKATLEDRDFLRVHADGDGSGFVSTVEGSEFRELIELGYMAAWMIHENGASLDRIAVAASVSPDEIEAKIDRYNRLAERLNAETRHRMPVIRLNADG